MKIERNGMIKTWDPVALEWKWQPSNPNFHILPLDDELRPKEGRFVCPDCGAGVEITVHFCGWEVESVDPVTGIGVALIDGSREDVHEVLYGCALACGWGGGDEYWWESIHSGEEDEEEEEGPSFPYSEEYVLRTATPDQV